MKKKLFAIIMCLALAIEFPFVIAEDMTIYNWDTQIPEAEHTDNLKQDVTEATPTPTSMITSTPVSSPTFKPLEIGLESRIAAYNHVVGVRSDGTVAVTGSNREGECNVDEWTDIVAVSAGFEYTVGLHSDGTVVATGGNSSILNGVKSWKNIVQISSGFSHTVGLSSDGTVVAVGYNNDGECDVREWEDIISVAAGASHTVGLRADGTVITTGSNYFGQCDKKIDDWANIIAISAGWTHTVGLRSDGTVVAVGDNSHGQCEVDGWKNIIAISAASASGSDYTVGLRSDGTVVAVGSNDLDGCNVEDWTNVIAISAGDSITVGMQSDGSVYGAGFAFQQYELLVDDWNLMGAKESVDEYISSRPTLYKTFIYRFGGYEESETLREKAKNIVFVKDTQISQDAVDVSEEQNGSIMAWLDSADNTLYISSDGVIMAPKDCEYLFAFYENVETIEFNGLLDTREVRNMNNMFCGCRKLRTLDISGFNIEKVTSMEDMFEWCDSLTSQGLVTNSNVGTSLPSYHFQNAVNGRAFSDMLILSKGDSGNEVRSVQIRLAELGYLNDSADGVFGRKTQQAIYDFQSMNGFASPSGVATPITQYVLYSDDAIPQSGQARAIDKGRGNCLKVVDLGYCISVDNGIETGYIIGAKAKNTSDKTGILACTVCAYNAESENTVADYFFYRTEELGIWTDDVLEPGNEEWGLFISVVNDKKYRVPSGIKFKIIEVCYSDGQVYHDFGNSDGTMVLDINERNFLQSFEYWDVEQRGSEILGL